MIEDNNENEVEDINKDDTATEECVIKDGDPKTCSNENCQCPDCHDEAGDAQKCTNPNCTCPDCKCGLGCGCGK